MNQSRAQSTLALLGASLMLWVAAACGDDPFQVNWESNPDTVRLFSLSRPELNLPSGFDFVSRSAIRIESQSVVGRWDIVVDTDGGSLVAITPTALGFESRARIADLGGEDFESVIEAPADTADYTVGPVALRGGNVYVVRSHTEPGAFGLRCNYYAKFVPLRTDLEEGILDFVYEANPVCNSRDLVPPD